ncbi:hypothetical protein C8R44DRAFT_729880 [Mycena epipterygia]|nr:hypothetical protein C8R44DRAFT_729880 [Mycena epipterygia]
MVRMDPKVRSFGVSEFGVRSSAGVRVHGYNIQSKHTLQPMVVSRRSMVKRRRTYLITFDGIPQDCGVLARDISNEDGSESIVVAYRGVGEGAGVGKRNLTRRTDSKITHVSDSELEREASRLDHAHSFSSNSSERSLPATPPTERLVFYELYQVSQSHYTGDLATQWAAA